MVYSSCSTTEHKETYLNHNPDVKYVGIETCASCHEDKHSTFIHTGMGLSFDSATQEKSSAVFSTQHKVYDRNSDMYYYPYWSKDKLFIKEFRLSNQDTIHQLDVQINYIVGSGQHTNSHLFSEQGYVYQAPITFYVQEQKWDLAPGFENGNNARFSRILNSECVSCHNAMPQLTAGSDYKFTQIGKGIDCERCHGPGELHVAERKLGKGADVKKGIDPTIVNPRKLSWERQIDLCQRCHLQGLNVLKEGRKFTDFKPGMVLSDVFEIYLPQYEGENGSFDMANHSQRFQMSECFVQSNSKALSFTCISCHNPHISVKQTGKEVYNAACKNCHQTKKCTEMAAALLAAKHNCVSCHMPANGSVDIPHVSVHDHYIRKPKSKEDVQNMQKLIGLYAVNNSAPVLGTQIQAYLEYWEKFDKNPFYLTKAFELLAKTKNPKLWLKYYYLTENYAKAIQLKLENVELTAWENFMLGEAFGKQNQKSISKFHIKRAFEQDGTQVVIGIQLLKYYLRDGELVNAQKISNLLLADFPRNVSIVNSTAQLNIMQGNLSQGKQRMVLALKLNPDDVDVWLTHFNYFVKVRDKQKVIYWAKRIQSKNPSALSAKQVAQIVDNMT